MPDHFTISIGAEESLSVAEIWPDGGAPENPTIDDVIAEVQKCGSIRTFMRDWNIVPEGVEVNGRDCGLR